MQSLRSKLVTREPDEYLIWYLSGFFDGEGCVVIGNNGSIQLRVINTNLKILELFKKTFGGSIGKRKQIVNKPQYVWSAYGDLSVKLCYLLASISIEKREQFLKCIEWFNERHLYPPISIPGKRGRFANEDRLARIKWYQKQLTQMKKELDVVSV